MGRTSWVDDGDADGSVALFQANVRRSLFGKAGQAALREMEAALLSMPDKAIYRDVFVTPDGESCALGALAVERKVASGLSREEAIATYADADSYDSEEIGESLGCPRLVAQAIVWQNDEVNDVVWEVAHGPVQRGHGIYKGGIALIRDMTPQERYDAMLKWVRAKLRREDD
jgi:hypothetical protein